MNEATTEIKNKIRALLAKAEGTEHEGEAALFMGKAMELMEKYQVELFDLHVDDEIGMTKGVDAQPGPPSYKSDVQCALAAYYGARAVIWGHSKAWYIQICGPESARVTTELMTDFVWAQVGAQASKMVKDLADNPFKKMNRGMAVREISKALCIRIRREVHQRRPQDAPRGSSLSLVVSDATQAWMDMHYGKDGLEKSKSRPKSASMAAMDLAMGIKLNHQFGSRDAKRLE